MICDRCGKWTEQTKSLDKGDFCLTCATLVQVANFRSLAHACRDLQQFPQLCPTADGLDDSFVYYGFTGKNGKKIDRVMFFYNDSNNSTHTVIEEVSDMIDYKQYATDLIRSFGQPYIDAAKSLDSEKRIACVGKIANGETTITSDPEVIGW